MMYLITTGCASDYRVLGACTTMGHVRTALHAMIAESMRDAFHPGFFMIEMYIPNDCPVDDDFPLRIPFRFQCDEEGNPALLPHQNSLLAEAWGTPACLVVAHVECASSKIDRLQVRAPNEEHAVAMAFQFLETFHQAQAGHAPTIA